MTPPFFITSTMIPLTAHFHEVPQDLPPPKPRRQPLVPRDRKAVVIWLTLCTLLVAAMVFVGGYTRLSGSGLSIADWKPVHGIIPPLNQAEWEEEFSFYRQTPQFQKVNHTMTLAEFKTIFWPEYWHRVLGRSIGFVFLLPLLGFLARRSLSFPMALRLTLIFALGGIQGFVGWFMVKSGLIDNPAVSPIRLMAHLSIAFTIFGLLVWQILTITSPWKAQPKPLPTVHVAFYALFFLVCVQIIYGALVAGLKAGLVFNTFPTMNGVWIPSDLLFFEPWYENLYHNITTVQFIHRWNAIFLVILLPLWWCIASRDVITSPVKSAGKMMLATLGVQFALGVLTLINAVPLPLALLHQMTALVLFGLMVALMHALRGQNG